MAARARHGVQPSTGGSKAGSTPTYNCGPAGSPPGLGCALRPNQRGGEWRLRRWRATRRLGVARGSYTGGAAGHRQQGTAGGRRGDSAKRQLQAGCTRPPPPPRVAPVRHPSSHSCGLLACLLTRSLARSRTPRGACPSRLLLSLASLPAFTPRPTFHGGTARKPPLSRHPCPPGPYSRERHDNSYPIYYGGTRRVPPPRVCDVIPFFLSVLRFLRASEESAASRQRERT